MAPTVAFLGVTWNGSDVSSFARVVQVEDDDRMTDRAQIDFQGLSAGATMADQQSLKIELGWTDEHSVLFDGLITEVHNAAGTTGDHRTRVTALDLSSRMNVTARPHTWDSGTMTSQIRTMIGNYHLEAATIEASPDPTLTPQHAITSSSQTDLFFLQDLARRYGCRCFVEYNEGRSQFYFVAERTLLSASPLGLLDWCGGLGHLKSFEYRRGAGAAPPSITATVADPSTGQPATTTPAAPASPAPIAVDDHLASRVGAGDSGARAGYVAAVTTAATTTETHADHVRAGTAAGAPSDLERAVQDTRRDLTAALGFSGEGTAVGTVQLRAKALVTIQGIAPWAAGDWYVRRAQHTWRDTSVHGQRSSTYETRFAVTR